MSEQLKPCPFCGGDAILNDPGGSSADCYDITIRCLDCDAEVACLVDQDHNTDGGAEAKAEVTQHWNRRTPDLAAAVQAERRACAEMLATTNERIEWFGTDTNGVPLVVKGERDFVRLSEVHRFIAAEAARIRARGDTAALDAAIKAAEARGMERAAAKIERVAQQPEMVAAERREFTRCVRIIRAGIEEAKGGGAK